MAKPLLLSFLPLARERERERRERGEKEIERVCMMELCCIRQAGRTGNLPSLEPLRVPQT